MNGGRRKFFYSILVVLSIIGSISCVDTKGAGAPNATTRERLVQTSRDKQISTLFTRFLEGRHVTKHKIDATVSQRSFELFLKAIDPTKLYFNQSDVDEFAQKYMNSMALDARNGNLTAAFDIYERFLQRVDERCAIAQKLLEENNFDFTVDEVFERDKKTATYPKNADEVYDRMRKRVKFEILSLEAENREKQREAENDADAKSEEPAPAPIDGRADDPISKLKRRYSTLLKRMNQTTNDDLLEIYLTAISNAYDPHSTYMSPKSYDNFMIQIGLNLEGIGATLQWDDGYTIVKRIVKGSPAEKQGELQVEDKIVGVGQGTDGPIEDVVDMKLTDVVDKIRGKGGTTVRLEVVSQDGKKKIISIVREKVDLEDSAAQSAIFALTPNADGGFDVAEVTSENPAPADAFKVGFLDLPSFYLDMKSRGSADARSVSADAKRILNEFNAQNVDACIVDLRYNGGGSLPEAVKLTGLFIEQGAVVQTKPAPLTESAQVLNDPDPSIEWTKPLVVLTSRLSASASEIFAGAIRDYGRGIIIGDETTHGKGSVQSMQELSEAFIASSLLSRARQNFGAIKITIQGYYLPSGVSPQLQGVRSDVVLPQFTSALDDIAESDLDYPLTFSTIPQAKYPKFGANSKELVDYLASRSKERVAKSKDFQEEIEKIELYKESPLRKRPTLNREKYFAELDQLNANKEETDKMEEIVNGDVGVKRDYYLDETLFITKDYVDALKSSATL